MCPIIMIFLIAASTDTDTAVKLSPFLLMAYTLESFGFFVIAGLVMVLPKYSIGFFIGYFCHNIYTG